MAEPYCSKEAKAAPGHEQKIMKRVNINVRVHIFANQLRDTPD